MTVWVTRACERIQNRIRCGARPGHFGAATACAGLVSQRARAGSDSLASAPACFGSRRSQVQILSPRWCKTLRGNDMAPVPYTVQGFRVYGFVYGGVVFRMVCTPGTGANGAVEGWLPVRHLGVRLAMTQKPARHRFRQQCVDHLTPAARESGPSSADCLRRPRRIPSGCVVCSILRLGPANTRGRHRT